MAIAGQFFCHKNGSLGPKAGPGRTALRRPNPQGFFDKLTPPEAGGETDDGQAKGSTMMGTVLACQLTLSSNR